MILHSCRLAVILGFSLVALIALVQCSPLGLTLPMTCGPWAACCMKPARGTSSWTLRVEGVCVGMFWFGRVSYVVGKSSDVLSARPLDLCSMPVWLRHCEALCCAFDEYLAECILLQF